jgi:prophage tail gpP-like protein
MRKRYSKRVVWVWAILSVASLPHSFTQDEPKAAKKPELIVVQVKVSDKKTAVAIDNADVRVKWGETEADSISEPTNSKGIARLADVPRGMVGIRVIAHGYAVGVKTNVDLKKEEQPIKIELEKETLGHAGDGNAPPTE